MAIDSLHLYDRVPVYCAGRRQTLRLRSWRDIAAAIKRGESIEPGLPTIVVVNNGRVGAGSHFNGTRARRANNT